MSAKIPLEKWETVKWNASKNAIQKRDFLAKLHKQFTNYYDTITEPNIDTYQKIINFLLEKSGYKNV